MDQTLENSFISKVSSGFKKTYKESTDKFIRASQAAPPNGIPLDNPLLEYALGRRFIAHGRCYLVYGKKGNSKTSFLFDLFKLYQQNGGLAIWIETERAADFDYAKSQGVDIDKLMYHSPATLEEGLTLVEKYVENLPELKGIPVIIGFDSIAGTVTEYEEDQDVVGHTKVGEHAKVMANFYRRIIGPLEDTNCIFVALNQLKEKIGGMPSAGEQEAMLGGEAPRFHSTIQFKMVKIGNITATIEGHERKVGSRHIICPTRNKLGIEGKEQTVAFDLYAVGGADWFTTLVKFVAEHFPKFISGSAWVTWNIPDVKYTDPQTGETKVINTEDKFRAPELGVILKHSTEAKEMLRTAFGVKPMPSLAEVAEIEKAQAKKNKKKEL